jgi:hypothetical protein
MFLLVIVDLMIICLKTVPSSTQHSQSSIALTVAVLLSLYIRAISPNPTPAS